MPLVRSLAARYAGRGEPLEDLVQVGAVGLIKAIERFDVDRGVEFTTFAVPTIARRDPASLPRPDLGDDTSRAGSRS